jgi:hypothetical protein
MKQDQKSQGREGGLAPALIVIEVYQRNRFS